jgi:hypothetical protein
MLLLSIITLVPMILSAVETYTKPVDLVELTPSRLPEME